MRATTPSLAPALAQALAGSVNELVAARENAAIQVDALVMAVTEGLCLLEQRNGDFMALPKNRDLKARLLAGLGELDRLMATLRKSTDAMCCIDMACAPAERDDSGIGR